VPELPEVETVRRGLAELVVGRTIDWIDVLEPKCFIGDPAALTGHVFAAARRRGKVLILDLDGGLSLVAHLKMTGQMVFRGGGAGPDAPGVSADPAEAVQRSHNWGAGHPTDSLIGDLPDRSTRVVVHFTDRAALYFNDQRKFGWLALTRSDQVQRVPLIAKMGPEPLEGDPWPEFRRRARRHQGTSIKAALLNQEVVAGIGNIYADEALWHARVHPATRVGDVSDAKLKALLAGAAASMELSLSLGGSTDRNYVDAEGRRGAYLDFAEVFRRDGQPCRRCGREIVKTRVAGRGTHYCPKCQREPRA
jgi:formamidopyrimidine-DNA glycosylase